MKKEDNCCNKSEETVAQLCTASVERDGDEHSKMPVFSRAFPGMWWASPGKCEEIKIVMG